MGGTEEGMTPELPLWADALSDAVFIHDWQGQIICCNQVACNWFGFDRGTLGKLNLFTLSSTDASSIQGSLAQQRESSCEMKLSNGRVVNIRFHLFPFGDEKNVISIAKDITAEKAMRRIDAESDEWFHTLFYIAPSPYFLYDLTGTIIEGNAMAVKMVGENKGNLVGRNFFSLKLLPVSQFPKALSLLAINAMGKGTGPDEFDLQRPDGIVTPIEISTCVITRENKKIVLAVANDISAKKKLQKVSGTIPAS